MPVKQPVFDYKPIPVVVEAPVVETPQIAPEQPTVPTVVASDSLQQIIMHESGGNPYAVNPSSGACGLFQKLPCNVPLGNVEAQMVDGLAYINNRYGSADNAWAFWLEHGWY